MALDLQQRPAQHGHLWDHTYNETENGRVVLQADPIKNGGITVIPTSASITSSPSTQVITALGGPAFNVSLSPSAYADPPPCAFR